MMSTADPQGFYGFSKILGTGGDIDAAIHPPEETFPMMGYKQPRWVSPYNYCLLMNTFGYNCNLWEEPSVNESMGDWSNILSSAGQENGFLLVSGVISPTAGTAELLTVEHLPELPPDAANLHGNLGALADQNAMNYSLVQLDGSDQVLSEQPIPLLSSEGEYESFVEVVPYMENTVRVEIRQEDNPIVGRTASPNAPSITLIAPNGGETWGEAAVVSWSASDVDGDDLTFDLLFSKDGGLSWQVIALDIVGNSYAFSDLRGIPGSDQARLRIVAKDGFNSSMDESEADFFVVDGPPVAVISTPADGASRLDQNIILRGFAFDDEDGALQGDALQWYSDMDGFLGSGSEVWAGELSQGWHTITFAATDSSGQTAEDTIVVQVGDFALIPMIAGGQPIGPPD